MSAVLVKRCPACATEHSPHVLRCGCGVLLAGVDLTPPAALASDAPTTIEPRQPGHDATGTIACAHADCAQPNPAGRERCLYCDRPLAPVAHALYWPWGERTPVGRELLIGRVAPAPPALAAEINRAYDNVSRRHAILRDDGMALTVEDLGSTNGTFIDEVRIDAGKPVRVQPGATVRFAADLTALVERQ